MKKSIFKTQSAFFMTALLISGCESNSVNGYFSNAASSSTSGSQELTSTDPITTLPTTIPTMIPTSQPGPSMTPTPTPTPTPTVTVAPTQAPTPTTLPTVTPAPSQTPVALPSTFVPNGILNGHFDVDTATTSMPFPIGSGTVTYHVHEYDKLNKTTTVDFFNLINNNGISVTGNESDFDQIQKTIPASKRFYLVVVNAPLNPGGVLELNDSVLRVTDYLNLTQQLIASGVRPPAYTIGTPTVAGDIQLKSLKIAFDSNVTADKLLVPTGPTDCVFPDIAGKMGEYRDGALVMQAIDASSIQLNASTGSATSSGGLIWEGIIYNHFMTTDQHGEEVDPEICY